MRIRAEVVRTDDGSAIWTNLYDKPYGDLFALQDELTRAIAVVLKAKLLAPEAKRQDERPPNGSVEAYSAYLRGKFYADRGEDGDMRLAIAEMTRATRLDPKYASAWAALSRNWTTLAALGLSGDEAQNAYAEARKAGDVARTLAPDLGDVYVARGWLLENQLDWRGATEAYQRGLELSPGNLQTMFSKASMLALQGQLDEAITLTRQALDNDPMSPNWWNWYSAYLSAVGQRTNEIMKYLTIMSAVFLPLAFVVGFFGQNFQDMPGFHDWTTHDGLMWVMIGACVSIPITMLVWFRLKRWL